MRDGTLLPRAAAGAIGLALLMLTCGPVPLAQDSPEPGAVAAAPGRVAQPAPATPAAVTAPPTTPAAAQPPQSTAPATAEPEPPVVPPQPPPRAVVETGWSPFATVGGIVLAHPSARVERVGFHQSNHEGAQQMEIAPTAVAPVILESRERLTGSRSAADVVVDPHVEIRAPVSGTVLRAGTYVLYCEHQDDFAVIEPDGHPGWEVKLLHIDGVQVRQGARVEAGVTLLARGPTPLPFASQVDEHTAEPSWPHVHIEVVDPSIPNRPSPGGGC